MFGGLATFGHLDVDVLDGVSTIREAVYSWLATTSDVASRVDDRGFFGNLPQDSPLPAVTFHVASNTSTHHLRGSAGTQTARVSISAWSHHQLDIVGIIEAIRLRLDGFGGEIGGVEILACHHQGDVDLPEAPKSGSDNWLYRTNSDYRVSYRVPIPSN